MEEMLRRIRAAAETRDIDLSDFEVDFLASIEEAIKKGWNLSKRRREILDQIHNRIPFWFKG